MDFPIDIAVPAGTTCSGTVAGQQNVCFMKIANCEFSSVSIFREMLMEIANNAGPFGGVIAFQMAGTAAAGNSTAVGAGTAAAAGTANTASTASTKGTKADKATAKAAEKAAKKAAKGTTAKRFVA
jgi:hypothetical protein